MASSLDILERLLDDAEAIIARQGAVLGRFNRLEERVADARHELLRMMVCEPSAGEQPPKGWP